MDEAVQLAPSRVDIQNTLAMALVTNDVDSKSLPWKRIATLVNVEDNASAVRNKLFHATLLASRGEEQQVQQARDILKELIDAADSETSDDALRYLIVLDQKVWKMSVSAGDTPRSRELALDIQRGFDQLTKRSSPAAMDLDSRCNRGSRPDTNILSQLELHLSDCRGGRDNHVFIYGRYQHRCWK
ncbi:MAG: hypothetical protein NTY15_21625 [Planctomycetota bacterium]|nr:hypothetical protein [Planctomycetota bacterium]